MSFQIATAIFKFVAGRTIACSQQDASLAQKAANLFSQFGNSTILPQGEPCQPSWQCAGRVIPLIPTCSFSDLLTRNTSQILLNSLSNIFIYIISWSNSNWYRDVTEDDIMSTKRFKYDKNVFWLDEWKSSLMNGYNLPRYWNDCINFFGLRNLRVFPPLGSWSTNKIVKSVGCLLNMVSPVETLPIHRASLNGTCHPDHPTMEWVLDE